jgi:3-deoxy-D-manno-octulosonate 8-phosphate phosphatase (KDO 8-P phosphatase)
VWIDQNGFESVKCDRRDGLAFDLLRSFIKLYDWNVKYFILSTEINPVVKARAHKMQVNCVQGVPDKAAYLREYLEQHNQASDGLIYAGNDLNDLSAMRLAGFSVAPADAHPVVLSQASLVLSQPGGDCFVRTFVERLLRIDQLPLDDLTRIF